MLGCIWQYVYTSFLRYWLKWLIRQATGKCELQRICSGYKPGATRTTKAGESNHPKSSLSLLFMLCIHFNKFMLTCFLCPVVEYSLRSSKNKVGKCYHCYTFCPETQLIITMNLKNTKHNLIMDCIYGIDTVGQ